MDTPGLPPAPEPRPETPLLPPFLLGPAALLWLWVLPVGVLLLLNYQGFQLIEGNLVFAQRSAAHTLGFALGVNLLAGLALFGLTTWLAGKNPAATAHPLWGLPAVVVQVAYLWLAVTLGEEILPPSVTTWIYPPERFLLNQFAFAMPPLFLGILRLAGARPAAGLGRIIAVNLGLAVGAPVLLYVLLVMVRHETRPIMTLVAAGVIVMGGLMFFGLIRCLLVLLRGARKWGATGERVAIFVFALLLPLAGLLLNSNIPFPVDFQAWEVYVLTIANATILLLASSRHAALGPRASFCLLCATLPFSLYFFIVFLPYTPLSIFAVLAMGLGFLVLTPTFLFVLHLHLLNSAWREVAPGVRRSRLLAAGLGCGLLLPAFFTGRGLADRAALNAALDYVYAPAVTAGGSTYPASRLNLRRAFTNHRSYKNGIYYPLLSDYYSWLVFDNLVLPDDKLDRLEATFFGAAGSRENLDPLRIKPSFWGSRGVRARTRMPRVAPLSRTVTVRDLQVGLRPAEGRAGIATFKLTLVNTGSGADEYRQALPLPPGVFVNGFRLHINGVPVPGRIVEKKTALWVYTMIRDSERRDPGLLLYTGTDELELSVFPVNAGTPVVVEIDFLVPAELPADTRLAGSTDPARELAQLGLLLPAGLVRNDAGSFAAGGLDALGLPGTAREPYLHLIIDRSAENGFNGDLSAAIRTLQEKFPAGRRARVTLANYDVADLVLPLTPLDQLANDRGRDMSDRMPLAGGFALDLALAHALRLHRDLDLDSTPASPAAVPPVPVFVILSQTARPATPNLALANAWAHLVPGVELHELGSDGKLVAHRPGSSGPAPLLRLGRSVRPLIARHGIRFEPAAADNAPLEFWSAGASAWQPVPGLTSLAAGTPWSQAVALQLRQHDYARSPGDAGIDLPALVKASRDTGILLASTSYIVVENQAQWNMLEQSERRKLGQNSALEFKETPAPGAGWLLLGFGLWLACRRWRVARTQSARALA